MKLKSLLEGHEMSDWVEKYLTTKGADVTMLFRSGKIIIDIGNIHPGWGICMVTIKSPTIPYKIELTNESLAKIILSEKVTSLKNLPPKMDALQGFHQEIEEVDANIEADSIQLNNNQIKSVEGIHTKLKCKKFAIHTNPISGSMLDILRIPNLQKIFEPSAKPKDLHLQKVNNVIKILAKYVGQGNQGIIKAQRELIENDLEDFA